MLSFNSLKNFIYINGLIFGTVYLSMSGPPFLVFLLRNCVFVEFIKYSLRDKENINPEYIPDVSVVESYVDLFVATAIETITYAGITQCISPSKPSDLIYFIPKSFLFELIFDFFHYWTHRVLHTRQFYFIHKPHHRYTYPTPICTFCHSTLDLIITNSIPQLVTFYMLNYFSVFEVTVMLTYKSFIEISGHSSKKLYPIGSFCQFIWLPRLLGISLYTEDHTMHHSKSTCNYGKRTWDKLFGTYV